MAIRNSDNLSGLFDELDFGERDNVDNFNKDRATLKYEDKVKQGHFSEFTHSDWRKYFAQKAKESGIVKYITGNPLTESSILKSLMGNFSHKTIKDMIDFVWECDHKLVNHKETIGIWILSKSWLQSVYPLSVKWKENGDIHDRKPREWREVKSEKPKKVSKFNIRSDED